MIDCGLNDIIGQDAVSKKRSVAETFSKIN